MSSNEDDFDPIGYVMDEETILLRLASRGISAGFESEISQKAQEVPALVHHFSATI